MVIKNLQEQKYQLLEEFQKLTKAQLELLRNGEYEEVVSLAIAKDALLEQVDGLDGQLGANKNTAGLLAKIKELQELNALLELELQNAKTNIGLKLVELQQSKQTENKYQQHYTQVEGAFIDSKQ